MALAGLRELGITDPKGKQRKDFVVFVETYRCATDAIIVTTGLTPGRRSLRVKDFGKMAATFVHLPSGRAVRVNALESSREKAASLAETLGSLEDQNNYLEALILLPEEDLLHVREVLVDVDPRDLPGPPTGFAICCVCGETVLDGRHVHADGRDYCQPCADGTGYYKPHAQGPLEGKILAEVKQ
jgi:formylmethanofuran dehydrogenase subunit E